MNKLIAYSKFELTADFTYEVWREKFEDKVNEALIKEGAYKDDFDFEERLYDEWCLYNDEVLEWEPMIDFDEECDAYREKLSITINERNKMNQEELEAYEFEQDYLGVSPDWNGKVTTMRPFVSKNSKEITDEELRIIYDRGWFDLYFMVEDPEVQISGMVITKNWNELRSAVRKMQYWVFEEQYVINGEVIWIATSVGD